MYSFPEIARLLDARVELPDDSLKMTGVSIDTRTLEKGSLFVALPGAQADGHAFLEPAFAKGASGALIEKKFFLASKDRLIRMKNLIPVEDPARALAVVAGAHRLKFHLRAIGITGSVGKTTTKEFLNYMLTRKYAALSTKGNFNNHLGLPLTLLGLGAHHRFCIAELGANHLGEIRQLSGILKPDSAILTRVCPAHLEGFGSLAAVYQAKTELFESLKRGSPVVIPDDDQQLFAKAHRLSLKVVTVGFSEYADYRIDVIEAKDGMVSFLLNNRRRFSFRSHATFLVRNAAMAAAMAEHCGVSLEDIPEVWDDLRLPSGRFEEVALRDGVRGIFDGYNANPESFEKAVDSFCRMPFRGKRVMVFSDMLELGAEARGYHESLGRYLAGSPLHYVAAYGAMSRYAIEAIRKANGSMPADHFEKSEEVARALFDKLEPGDGVLFKASRGMKVESVLKFFEERPGIEKQQVS